MHGFDLRRGLRRLGARLARRVIAAAVVAATLATSLSTTVAAVPVERTRSIVDCAGSSVSLVMHPGQAGIAQWDISTEEVQNGPSYLITYVEGEVFVGGELVGTFATSIGKKLGLGEPLQCSFEVHKPGFDVYGYTEIVQLR